MTITAVKSKLLKAGYTIAETSGSFRATKANFHSCIEWHRNGKSDDASCLRARQLRDKDDSMSDYTAGSFCDSIKYALDLADRMHKWALESEQLQPRP